MTARLSELMNRQVIATATGEKVGVMKDALLDVDRRMVAGFVLSGAKGESVLAFEKVRTFGPDAVMIDTVGDVAESASGPVNARRFGEIAKVQVLSTSGAAMGNFDDVAFNAMGGAIESFEIAEGGVFGLGAKKIAIPAAAVRGIGPDAVTVEPEVKG